MDIIKKINDFLSGKDKKKLLENTAIVAIIGVIIIIAGSTIFSGPKPEQTVRESRDAENTDNLSHADDSLGDVTEKKLKSMLSQMQGVGKVDVMITYESSKENIPAYDTKKNRNDTVEKDSEGGTREITQEEYDSTLAFEESADGRKIPVILTEMKPKVRGVLVVAEGADSVTVRERIVNAVSVVLDIPVHKVDVVQRKK